MSLFSNIIKRYKDLSPKQLMLGGVFALALAGTIGLGLANRQGTFAYMPRECDPNSIDRVSMHGGCGAATPAELVADARSNNPSDLQAIYSHFGLAPSQYDAFADPNTGAKQGTLFRDGHIEVEGQTVADGVWTMGRKAFNGQREPVYIGNNTYYHSFTPDSFADGVKSLPVMVWFEKDGTVKVVIMNPCGNPVTKFRKITPKAVCKQLVTSQPDQVSKPNTYRFTAQANFENNAVFSKAVYTFSDDGTSVTKTSLTDPVEHTFKKDGTVKVTIFAKVPGGHEIQATHVILCEKQIRYIAPFFKCEQLKPIHLDEQKRKFRFTVYEKHDVTTTLTSADFTLDGTSTTTGVTEKDVDGRIFKEYAFNDEKDHLVVAKVNFNTTEGAKSVTCQAKVTPGKLPKCTVPGKEHLPPDHPDCKPPVDECLPNIPKGDVRCNPPQVLSKTGPASTIGMFAGASGLGFLGHRLFLRLRREQ
jgi:hypothetical protein